MEAPRKSLSAYRISVLHLPGQPLQGIPEPVYHTWFTSRTDILQALETTARCLGRLDSTLRSLPMWPAVQRLFMTKSAVDLVHLEGGRISMQEAFHREESVDLIFRMDWLRVQQLITARQASWTGPDAGAPMQRRMRSIHAALSGSSGGAFRKGLQAKAQSLLDMQSQPPCPAAALPALLDDLERFLDDRLLEVPLLLRLAIADAQTEFLQPFEKQSSPAALLMLDAELHRHDWLPGPVGLISMAAAEHHTSRKRLLQQMASAGTMEDWFLAWLRNLELTSQRLERIAKNLTAMMARIEGPLFRPFGRKAPAARNAVQWMYFQPVLTASQLAAHLKVSIPTANSLLELLVTCGVAKEITGHRRNRIFIFEDLIRLLEA